MQSPGVVYGMSFRKNPRSGQRRVFESLTDHKGYLNIQLPTGYGKTFTAAGCYSIKKQDGEVNRLLVIFPTDAQLIQFENDGHRDLEDAGVEGSKKIVDVRFFGAEAIRKHRRDEAQVFVITAQALIQRKGRDNIRELMQTGRWMIVVDEYHHYGLDKEWGKHVKALTPVFLLAMSATPTRANNDSAFGEPHIQVTYRDAQKEGACKPLRGHSYTYRIDLVGPDQEIHSFTTSELADAAGSDAPDAVERLTIKRKMRWSPKYVSPLVSIPIERLLRARISSGQPKLQALIGAMCVSHAKLVCEQVSTMFPELEIDWVGTGMNGRSDDENTGVLKRFCPPKDEHGRRNPSLDVLVHVGMAGEGLDSNYVTEIIHLNRASKNNTNDQENGRAARALLSSTGEAIWGNINFDSSSDYAAFTGERIMDAMDGNEPSTDPEPGDPTDREFSPLPDDPPMMTLFDLELDHIDSGDPAVQRVGDILCNQFKGEFPKEVRGPEHPRHQEWLNETLRTFKEMRRVENEPLREKATIALWQDTVEAALSSVVGRAIKAMKKNGHRIEKSLPGDLKKRINFRKSQALGPIVNTIESRRLHYQWTARLDREILEKGIPPWLS